MPAKPPQDKVVADFLSEAANAITEAMTAGDANDPTVQGILQQLQQALVQTVHVLRQQKAQQMAGQGGGQGGQNGTAGQQLSAGPGQPGYGAGSPGQADMVAAMQGGGGGGGSAVSSGDEYSRLLGTVGRGTQ